MTHKVGCSVVSTGIQGRVNRRGNFEADDFGLTIRTLEQTIEVVVFGANRRALVAGLRSIADALEAADPSAVEAAA